MNLLDKIEYKKYIIINISILIAGIITGILIGHSIGSIGEIPFLKIPFYKYFIHNAKTCMILILLGVISYGILTWIPLVYNGFILGSAISFLSYQYSPSKIMILFSHAIFELPAVIIAIYLGRMISSELLKFIKRKNKNSFGDFLKKILKIIIFMIALLLFASFIEAMPK